SRSCWHFPDLGKPLIAEQRPVARAGPLLIQRIETAAAERALDLRECRSVVPLRTQRLAYFAAALADDARRLLDLALSAAVALGALDAPASERVIFLCERRQVDHAPLAGVRSAQDAAGQVVLMPARLNQNERSARLPPREQVLDEPFGHALAERLRLRFLTRLHGVVNHDQVRTVTRHTTTDADSTQATTSGRLPVCYARALRGQRDAFAHDAPHVTTEAIG